jgi:hypothetical protein
MISFIFCPFWMSRQVFGLERKATQIEQGNTSLMVEIRYIKNGNAQQTSLWVYF